jgi:hypothetical protein
MQAAIGDGGTSRVPVRWAPSWAHSAGVGQHGCDGAHRPDAGGCEGGDGLRPEQLATTRIHGTNRRFIVLAYHAGMRRLLLVGIAMAAGCGPHDGNHGDDGGGDDAAVDARVAPHAFSGPYDDFPGDPVIDTGAPTDAPGLFGDPTSGDPTGGPCLAEPEIGTLFPRNWLRPRFSWMPMAGENLYELRLTTANETNPLVVYTTATTWTMPAAMWTNLATPIVDQPITVAIRGATYDGTALTDGPSLGSSGDIAIAAVEAPGAIVYWTTTGGSALRGFHVGDESVVDIVRPSTAGSGVLCVGCHSSTPDGQFVGFSASPVGDNGDPTAFALRTADGNSTAPTFVTAQAQTLMARQNQEQPAFSPRHWEDGDRVGVTMYPTGSGFEIIWTDLETTSTAQDTGWGIIARDGDDNHAAYASFAHETDQLLYVSSPDVASGVTVHHGDLATVPYNDRLGGTAADLPGASTAEWNEYYPTFSPDDAFVAYNRVADGASSYNDSAAEVFVIPGAGGTPVRLAANDPPACSGRTSPGVTNSWPRWAPSVGTHGGRSYYWLIFSSTRSAGGNPQLYITPVVEDGGAITSYPALYLWNQPAAENNHTPAWDVFDIPVP